jgi:three-Cys-motif partner protein
MAKDIHKEPFDDGTLLKLAIFKDYLDEWLPVFVVKRTWTEVNIFDFFAGPGKDSKDRFGSPLLIAEQVANGAYNGKQVLSHLKENGIQLGLYFNEYDKLKFDQLQENLLSYGRVKDFFRKVTNLDFTEAFKDTKNIVASKNSANLLFLDQNGIKQIDESVFRFIIEQSATDFIFYISSSYLNRFNEHESFKKYLNISKVDFEGRSYHHCHKVVLDYYRSLIPNGTNYYLAPFSIKKGTNIYGLIFGSKHSLGMEKFLNVCWKHDKLTGEANYDIDDDKIDLSAPSLFAEYNKPKKMATFEIELTTKIKSGEISTNKDAYLLGLSSGFLPKHVNVIFRNLMEQKVVSKDLRTISSNIHRLLPELIKLI